MAATPFADLSPVEVRLVAATFHRHVLQSFVKDVQRDGRTTNTDSERRRRVGILERWFRTLRGEKRWTLQRTLAACADALRVEIDGGTYTPDSRTVWIPQDGA